MNTSPASNIPDAVADQSPAVELAVIVLNYRTPGMVIDCLESLEGQIQAPAQQVVVVDNNSGDDSAAQIQGAIRDRGWVAWVRFVQSPVNGGFAAGNNVGIRSIDAQVYLLLNSDTLVQDGAIEILLKTMDEHPEVHLLGPRLVGADGVRQNSTFRYRTPISDLLYGSGLDLLWRIFPRHIVARTDSAWCDDLDWISFACVTVRDEVFRKIDVLDDGYFMYFEDMDFCRNAVESGFKIAYQPSAAVMHLEGASSGITEASRRRGRLPAYYYLSRSRYFVKHYGYVGLLAANVLWELGHLVALLRFSDRSASREWIDIWRFTRIGRASKR